ncbi:MAG: P-loop NTPase [Firmicutes bacterium]|nr:P-loop NTPase [Bacillota bacterium]
MSEACNHDCGSCSSNCAERESLAAQPHERSSVKKVIGIVSGKGGVGKSMVTSMLAVAMSRTGAGVGVLDADITGPSIPRMFGIKKKAEMTDLGLYPVKTESGIDVMSINLLLQKDTDPVVWRGPVIAGAVKQFWTDVIWENEDYLFVDMPPGTGDVPLTVFQSLPIDGIVIVTTPQSLVSMVVSKAVRMAQMMNVPVLGIVENLSYFQCPDCGKAYEIYGKSHVQDIADEYHLHVLGRLPIDPRIAEACDEGLVESLNGEWLDKLAQAFSRRVKELDEDDFIRIAVPVDGDNIYPHFGKAEGFRMYNVENGQVVGSVLVDPAGSGHDAIAKFLKMYGVNAVICGGIGEAAVQVLNDSDIWVISGHEGKADDRVAEFLRGELDLGEATCNHDHGDGDEECDGDCRSCGCDCH